MSAGKGPPTSKTGSADERPSAGNLPVFPGIGRVAHLRAVGRGDGFSPAIGKINDVAAVIEAVHLATFVFEQVFDRVGAVVFGSFGHQGPRMVTRCE